MSHSRPITSLTSDGRVILTLTWAVAVILFCLSPDHVLAQPSPENEPDIDQLRQGKAYVFKLNPPKAIGTGKGYKLVYMVAAPLAVFWKFKTDFDNDFLLTNKLISKHRLVAHQNNVAITESIYATKPGVRFRWRTISFPDIQKCFQPQNLVQWMGNSPFLSAVNSMVTHVPLGISWLMLYALIPNP